MGDLPFALQKNITTYTFFLSIYFSRAYLFHYKDDISLNRLKVDSTLLRAFCQTFGNHTTCHAQLLP